MRALTRLAMKIFRLLIVCYPAGFRAEFGEEMRGVFASALREAQHPKRGQPLKLLWRELRDLPASLIRQHWLALRKETVPMTSQTESNSSQIQPHQPGDWGAALLAGLPHLLMGMLIGSGKLSVFDYQNSQTISAIIGTTLGLLVVFILILAWRRGFPLWSASWYLYGTWTTVAILSLTVERLNLQDSWRYTNALFVGWVLFCVIGYFILLSKSKMHGLLSIAFLFPLLGLILMEFVPNPIEGWLAISVGTLAALATGSAVRVGELRIALGLVLASNLLAGLAITYVGEYQMRDLPAGVPIHIPQFSSFLGMLALYSFFGLGIVALPFILRGLLDFGKRTLAS